ncbi:MAG: hypothetical protein O3A94_01060 [Proteobacteria bacterium]|nr:hypothetical protein [Pseudomonadota bacterium]
MHEYIPTCIWLAGVVACDRPSVVCFECYGFVEETATLDILFGTAAGCSAAGASSGLNLDGASFAEEISLNDM